MASVACNSTYDGISRYSIALFSQTEDISNNAHYCREFITLRGIPAAVAPPPGATTHGVDAELSSIILTITKIYLNILSYIG